MPWAQLGSEQETYAPGATVVTRGTATPSWNPASNQIQRQGLPDWARLTIQVYDNAGLVTHTVSPNGAVTHNVYDKGDRLIHKTENAYGTGTGSSSGGQLSDVRLTSYVYKFGRLVSIAAPGNLHGRAATSTDPLRAFAVTANGKQTTVVDYGADVMEFIPPAAGVAPTYTARSRNNGLVGTMRLPNPTSELPGSEASLTLRYTFSGQIAERIDARGCTFRYFYDDQDRLIEIEVGTYLPSDTTFANFLPGYPSSMTLGSAGAPVDRVGYVQYIYDAAGRMTDAKSFVNRGGLIISHNRFAYDLRGNLIRDMQSHGQQIALGGTAPTTSYEWDYQPTGTAPADIGFSRLLKIGYPAQPNAPPNTQPRDVLFTYGSAQALPGSQDQLSHTLSRIGAMSSTRAPQQIASFDFIGTDRRVGASFAGGGINVSLRDPAPSVAGVSGLDRFGRLRDLHYRNPQIISGTSHSQTLYRAEYTYDVAGNRLASNTTRAASSGHSLPNFKSQSHTYDMLDRLIGSRVGSLDASGVVPTLDAFREDAWVLDALGNPNGRELGTLGNGVVGFIQPGRTTSGNLDAFGTPWATVLASPADPTGDASQTTFQTDRRNRFTGISRATDLPGGAGGIGTTAPFSSIDPTYDGAGNCTFDGSYFYQYDAWNRLVQINAPTQGQWLPEGATAIVASSAGVNPAPLVPGALVKHFTYDALGRLIRTQSPFPNPADTDGSVRTERFYYDGIRRIQEVVVDPVRAIEFEDGSAGDAGDGTPLPPQLQQLANQNGGDGSAAAIAGESTSPTNVDGSTSTSSFEQAQIALNPANGSGVGLGAGTSGNGGSTLTGGSIGGIELSNATLAREYIWGPGGSFVGAAVDELLVQIDGDGRASWVMQDAGGDVVALAVNAVNPSGGPAVLGETAVAATGVLASATGTNLSFRVAAQQEYDAYGQVIWAEHLLNHAALHLGHKGLFVDRLDVGVGNGSGSGGNGNPGAAACAKTFGEPPRIVPLAFNLAQNRNRTLHMSWGRYLQQDPNASGIAALTQLARLGARSMTGSPSFDLEELYGDGPAVYSYLGSNPSSRSDPSGLEWAINYEGIIMPVVSVLDDVIGFGLVSALNELLQGYNIVLNTAGMLAGYSHTQVDMVDWATDWDRDDYEFSGTTLGGTNYGTPTSVASPEAVTDSALAQAGTFAMAGRGGLGPIHSGRAAELAGRMATKAQRVQRMIDVEHVHTPSGRIGKRLYDGFSQHEGKRVGHGTYFEYKAGKQNFSKRLEMQIEKDWRLKGAGRGDGQVKDVKWVFMYKGKNPREGIDPRILKKLDDFDIKYDFAPH